LYQVPGNSGENPERSRHCNPNTGGVSRELSLQVTVHDKDGKAGRLGKARRPTWLSISLHLGCC